MCSSLCVLSVLCGGDPALCPLYIELHAASAFSFLQGASLPETLVDRAAALGYPALALLDRDGVYGAPRFHQAAIAAGIRPIVGAELTIDEAQEAGTQSDQASVSRVPPDLCTASPSSSKRGGLPNLCRLITRMKLRAPKGEGALTLDDLDGSTAGLVALAGRAALDGAAARRRRAARSARRHLRPRVGVTSSCSGTCGATRKPTTRRSSIWPRRFACRSSPPTACGSRRRTSGRSSTCSPASATTRSGAAPAGGWRRTPSGI